MEESDDDGNEEGRNVRNWGERRKREEGEREKERQKEWKKD